MKNIDFVRSFVLIVKMKLQEVKDWVDEVIDSLGWLVDE